jgi:deoxyribose-phosphate aldolase
MMDLTTLEGKDTPGKVAISAAKRSSRWRRSLRPELCRRLRLPKPRAAAKAFLRGTTVKVASVATAFPSGMSPLSVKLEDVRLARDEGADEIDMVIDRGAFWRASFSRWPTKSRSQRSLWRGAPESHPGDGELQTYDHVRLASEIAMRSGRISSRRAPAKCRPLRRYP